MTEAKPLTLPQAIEQMMPVKGALLFRRVRSGDTTRTLVLGILPETDVGTDKDLIVRGDIVLAADDTWETSDHDGWLAEDILHDGTWAQTPEEKRDQT